MKNKKVLGCLLLASMTLSLIPQSSFAWGWPWRRNECCCEQPAQVIVQEKVIIKEEPRMEEPAPMMVEEKVEIKKSEEMIIPQDPGIAQPEPAPAPAKETKYYPGLW